jgi:hypothetical protein
MIAMQPVGSVPFIDGVFRPVFLDLDARQCVLDDDGQPIYGVWVYIEEPEIVIRAKVES